MRGCGGYGDPFLTSLIGRFRCFTNSCLGRITAYEEEDRTAVMKVLDLKTNAKLHDFILFKLGSHRERIRPCG